MSVRNHISLILILLTGFCSAVQAQFPEPPVIRFVSVDTLTGNVLINWEKGSGASIEKYVVYQGREGSDPLVADPIDTLDASVTDYIHTSSAAGSRSVPYTVASLLADDTSPLAPYHHTIHMTLQYDSCDNALIIEWTPYIGWNNDLIAYNVYIKTNTGDSVKIPSLSSGTTSYRYNDAIPYMDYCIYVEAENRNFLTSTSNRACINTARASPPSYINADFATVIKDKTIQLSFSFDPISQIHNFILFHGTNENKIVDPVAEFNNVLAGPITYTHEVFSTIRLRNYYQLAAVDQCPEKNPLKKSNIASNMILEATENNKLVTLHWSDYNEWQAGVKYYKVYRITNKTNIELIDSFNYGNTSVSDDISLLATADNIISDQVCYYVEAEENDNNIYGIKGYSRSNEICISVIPEIYMANAFTPDGNGSNDEIKPLLTFLPEKYLFIVFDRWGSKVFETTNPDEYWNGKINNKKKASPGVYTYYIKITTSGNIISEKKGTITLFYP